MKEYTVLSLFDGMSCGQIALERSGFKVKKYYASEIDKYAIKITQKNYPQTTQLGDITKWREWDIDFSEIDIILANYFGYHPTLKNVLKDRITESLQGEVKMNCDTCQYRLNAAQFVEHHHDHDHEHEHRHEHEHHDHDNHHTDHDHDHLVSVDK